MSNSYRANLKKCKFYPEYKRQYDLNNRALEAGTISSEEFFARRFELLRIWEEKRGEKISYT